MDESNNVISFVSKKALRDAGPAIDWLAKFKHLHGENLYVVEDLVTLLLDDLVSEFGILPSTIQHQDYVLLVEATMGLLLRAQGFEHPIIHPFADEMFKD